MTTLAATLTTFYDSNSAKYASKAATPTYTHLDVFGKTIELASKIKEKNELKESFLCLNDMQHWKNNWDEHGADSPKKRAISKAENLIKTLYKFIENFRYEWISPNITGSSSGEVVLEWWKNQKKITIYLSSTQILYIKVCNENVDDMEDGTLTLDVDSISQLWEWLIS
jgi:hypothetical protein